MDPARHTHRRIRKRDSLGVRADLRPPAQGDLLRQAADAPLRSLAPLPHGYPAPAGPPAEDAAAGRGPRPPARSGARLAERRAADPRALDERAGGDPRVFQADARRGPALGTHASPIAAPRASHAFR